MRPYHNLHKFQYSSDNEFGFPLLLSNSEQVECETFLDFNTALSCPFRNCGLHFFIDDFKFERIWTYPERYIDFLKSFECVIMPDFSLYYNSPIAVNIYNKYRNHWLYCFYQMHGVNIIPLFRLGSIDFFEWSSLGFPLDRSVYAISDIGCNKSFELKEDFKKSFSLLLKRDPLQVVYFTRGRPCADIPDDLNCKVIKLDYIKR